MKECYRNTILFVSVLLFALFPLELAARLFIPPVSRVNFTPQELVEIYKASYKTDAAGWIRSRKALERAKVLSEAHGLKRVLAIYPVLWDLSDDYPFLEIHETIADYADSLGVPVVDLLPAFNGYDGPELWAHPNNQHPNAEGHRIAVRALAEYLEAAYPDPGM